MSYYITIGDKTVEKGIKTEREASAKCCLLMTLTPRLDVFYHKD